LGFGNKYYTMINKEQLIDNEFLRQYEVKINNRLATIEYSLQERKIFLTKLVVPDDVSKEEFSDDFIKAVLQNIEARNLSVVPTSPAIAKFVRRNRQYKRMLPVGVRI
jgi:predicted GNAT family acetyltransferase